MLRSDCSSQDGLERLFKYLGMSVALLSTRHMFIVYRTITQDLSWELFKEVKRELGVLCEVQLLNKHSTAGTIQFVNLNQQSTSHSPLRDDWPFEISVKGDCCVKM